MQVRMPKLGDEIGEAAVIAWLKRSGDSVRSGEIIAEIETEKANVELEAEGEGVLQILVDAGERVAIGTPIATIGDATEAAPGTAPATPPGEALREPAPAVETSAPGARSAATDDEGRDRSRSSPSARKLARELGVDIARVTGSGPGGRIVRTDIERARSSKVGGAPVGATSMAGRQPDDSIPRSGQLPSADNRAPLSPLRAATARRMETSKKTAPHFYVTVEVRMDAAVRLLAEIGSDDVTITHLLLRAVALAAAEHPRVNASWADGEVVFHPRVDIGLAIALDDGLLSPALIDCVDKPILAVAAETKDLVARARHGRLTASEIGGGTITVSNLGMFGVDEFVAILNPPQAAIVAVGAVVERPVVEGGQVIPARTVRVTCSADHRVLDGVEVARFLATIRRLLEQPASLLA